MKLGKVITEERREKKLSQKDLASRLKISPQYLNDLERGRRDCSSEKLLKKFSKVFKIHESYFYFLQGKFCKKDRKLANTQKKFERGIEAFRKEVLNEIN